MRWFIAAILIAALIILIAWKLIKTILHVFVIAIVLAAGLVLFGYHEIHLPKGLVTHGHAFFNSLEHSVTYVANCLHHGLAKGAHTK